MRGSRVLLALAAWWLTAAAPLGTTYQRLSHGRVTRATMPSDVQHVAIYYGASWCGPCRAFVPELIAAYPRLRARGIEVVLVSDDATCAATLDYARTSRMPWLLLPCDPRRRAALRALGGKALPGIVVVDRTGAPEASSWRARDDSAPRALLATLIGR